MDEECLQDELLREEEKDDIYEEINKQLVWKGGSLDDANIVW